MQPFPVARNPNGGTNGLKTKGGDAEEERIDEVKLSFFHTGMKITVMQELAFNRRKMIQSEYHEQKGNEKKLLFFVEAYGNQKNEKARPGLNISRYKTS